MIRFSVCSSSKVMVVIILFITNLDLNVKPILSLFGLVQEKLYLRYVLIYYLRTDSCSFKLDKLTSSFSTDPLLINDWNLIFVVILMQMFGFYD